MEARTAQKLKLLYIIDILQKYSDEENPINATEICEKLDACGISAERKAVYNDIDVLIDYGYDIVKATVPRRGYFMGSRHFELPEIYLLCDAVRSANFITPKKTRELIEKLDSMLSVNQVKERESRIYINPANKFKNEEIYYSIDKINKAIHKGVKVSFKYSQRKLTEDRKIALVDKVFTVSPYALIWQNDRYYLVGNIEKYDNLVHLRLDKIRAVEILDKQKARHFSEVSEYTEFFDSADYIAKTFNMHGGELKRIELKCAKKILDQIIDRFSEDIFVYKVTEDSFSFSINAHISEGLISWLLQYGKDVEVVSPEDLRDMISERINDLRELYK